MKRDLNFFNALFLLFLYFKLSGTGPTVEWWEVFSPFYMEAAWAILAGLNTLFGVEDRVKFFFWKIALKIRVAAAAKSARKNVVKQVTEAQKMAARRAAGNPGQFIDPKNTGK